MRLKVPISTQTATIGSLNVYDWNMEFPVRSRVRLLGTAQQNIGICPMTLEPKVHVLGHCDPAPSSPTQVTHPQKFSFCLHFTVYVLGAQEGLV